MIYGPVAATELELGYTLLPSGRVIAEIAEANEWAGTAPIGATERLTLTFEDGTEGTYDADATFEQVLTAGSGS